MRAIDADELLEHVWREHLDSRERIAELVESRPTLDTKNLVMKEIDKIVSDYYMSKCTGTKEKLEGKRLLPRGLRSKTDLISSQ